MPGIYGYRPSWEIALPPVPFIISMIMIKLYNLYKELHHESGAHGHKQFETGYILN